jgi:hypothetical protein
VGEEERGQFLEKGFCLGGRTDGRCLHTGFLLVNDPLLICMQATILVRDSRYEFEHVKSVWELHVREGMYLRELEEEYVPLVIGIYCFAGWIEKDG